MSKRFSSFNLNTALEFLGINQLQPWTLSIESTKPSHFYLETLKKLRNHFDVSLSESAKSLLIDATLLEAITPFQQLKIWKEATLKTDDLIGTLDYLVAPQGKVFQHPLLCVVEAKKDDFEQGLAQCLVEMYACQQYNQKTIESVYGVITNADVWRFYQLNQSLQVAESPVYAETQIETILGFLRYIFEQCEKQLIS